MQHATEALVDAESYLANPVNAYRLCKKFTTEIPAVKELLKSEPLVTGRVIISLLRTILLHKFISGFD